MFVVVIVAAVVLVVAAAAVYPPAGAGLISKGICSIGPYAVYFLSLARPK